MTKHHPPNSPAALLVQTTNERPPHKRRGLARICGWLGRAVAGILALIVLVGLVLVLFAYGPSGAPTLARVTTGLVNGFETGIEIEVGSIALQWPLKLDVRDVRLRDKTGEWLKIPQLLLDVQPTSLLPTQKMRWNVRVTKALVRQATWSRLPVLAPELANPAPQNPQPLILLPQWLSIEADSILLEDARIGAAALALTPAEPYISAFYKVQMSLSGSASALAARTEIHAEIRPLADTTTIGSSAVTRLLVKADWKDNTLSLNTHVEDSALLAPYLPQPTLPPAPSTAAPAPSPPLEPLPAPPATAPTPESPLASRFIDIQGDITVHIPVLPPMASLPMHVRWALKNTSPALPTTTFSGDVRIDDAALAWEKVEIHYPSMGEENPTKGTSTDVVTLNSLRSEGSFSLQHGPTARLDLHLQDVASLAHFGLPMPLANGPLSATVNITAPATVSMDIQSPSLALPQGILQGLALKIQATSPSVSSPVTTWAVPDTLNGTLGFSIKSCMGFGPLNLSTSWGLENISTKLGVRIAALQADMLGVKLRGNVAYAGTFTDTAIDLTVTDTSAMATLFNVPLKGAPLTFTAKVVPNGNENAIKGQLNFKAGSYDTFEWQSGEGSLLVDRLKASVSLSILGKLSARVRCSYTFAEKILRIDDVELGESTRKLGAKLVEPTTIGFAHGVNIGAARISLQPAGTVYIKGKLEAQMLDFESILTNIPLSIASAFTATPIPQGNLSARMHLKGSPSSPTGGAQIRVNNMPLANTVGGPQASLVVDANLSRTGTQGKNSHAVQIKSHWEGLESLKDFTATAQIPLFFAPTPTLLMDGPLRANLAWQGDIAPLWRLVPLPGRTLSGKADVQVQVTGSLHKPVLTGQAFVGQGRFVDTIDGILLDDITLETRYTLQNQATLRLQATDGRGGSINLDGILSTPKITNSNSTGASPLENTVLAVRGNINKLRPLRRDDVAIQLSGTVDITGSVTAPLVAANICVDQGVVQLLDGFGGGSVKSLHVEERKASTLAAATATTKTNNASTLNTSKNSPRAKRIAKNQGTAAAAATTVSPTAVTPLSQVARCDIRVTAPGRVYIRGKGLDSEWKATLRLTGPLADPKIVGNVTPIRGTLDLLGHQFTLASSDIAFTGSFPPNPVLDINLEYKSADITALIGFSGSAKHPKMRLSSQPVRPNDEIIAQILFGKNINSLSRFEALQAANTARQLVELGPSSLDLMSSTRDMLGLEVLRFGSSTASRQSRAPRDASMQGTSSANPDDQGPTLEAGKQILDNVYVGVEQGTGNKADTVVRVEVELLPNLSLEGRTSNETTGVGVNWKRDY